jgi:hypothetical protein
LVWLWAFSSQSRPSAKPVIEPRIPQLEVWLALEGQIAPLVQGLNFGTSFRVFNSGNGEG